MLEKVGAELGEARPDVFGGVRGGWLLSFLWRALIGQPCQPTKLALLNWWEGFGVNTNPRRSMSLLNVIETAPLVR